MKLMSSVIEFICDPFYIYTFIKIIMSLEQTQLNLSSKKLDFENSWLTVIEFNPQNFLDKNQKMKDYFTCVKLKYSDPNDSSFAIISVGLTFDEFHLII